MATFFTRNLATALDYVSVPIYDGYICLENQATLPIEHLIAKVDDAMNSADEMKQEWAVSAIHDTIEPYFRGVAEFKYGYIVEHYDYFGGHKSQIKYFATPTAAIKAWRVDKKYEYSYDDSWTRISPKVFLTKKTKVANSASYTRRFHARSKSDWEDMSFKNDMFCPEELAYLMSFDIEDEDILI